MNNLDDFLVKVYDNLTITVYGRSINFREYQKRYYKALSNWVSNIILSYINKESIDINTFKQRIDINDFIEIVKISEFYSDVISFSKCKEIFGIMLETKKNAWEVIIELGLLDSNDLNLKQIIIDSINANPVQYDKYKKGNLNSKNFFIGDVMRNYKNKFNPKEIGTVLDIVLNELN